MNGETFDARTAAEAAVRAMENRRAKRVEDSLAAFVQEFWPVVEAKPLAWGQHMQAVCDALQEVAEGKVRRLYINIPPRCSKTLLMQVFFPAFKWLKDPSYKMWFLSHNEDLALDAARLCMGLMRSDEYQSLLSRQRIRWTFDRTKTSTSNFGNLAKGVRQCGPLGAGITGKGADFIGIDDPHDVAEATEGAPERIAERMAQTCDKFDKQISTRLNNAKTGAFCIIMQRVHEGDLTAHVAKEKDPRNLDYYHSLILPMHYDPSRADPRDWRREKDELLDPERFPQEVVEARERTLGHQASGQLEQLPVSPTGGDLPLSGWRWCNRTDPAWPKTFTKSGAGWDLAFGQNKSGAFHAGIFAGFARGYVWMEGEVHLRCSIDALMEAMDGARAKWPKILNWRVEDAAAARPVTETLRRGVTLGSGKAIPPFSNIELLPTAGRGDKVALMQSWQPYHRAGSIVLPCFCSTPGIHTHPTDVPHPEEAWATEFVSEAAQFPKGRLKDRVDATGQVMAWLFEAPKTVVAMPMGDAQSSHWG